MYGSDVDYLFLEHRIFSINFLYMSIATPKPKYNGGIQNTYCANEWNFASWKNGLCVSSMSIPVYRL